MKIEDYINIKDISDRLDGDFDLFSELSDLFFEDTNTILSKIENAILERNPEKIRKNAHTLKGSVSNFSAPKAFEAAMKLENIGKNNDLENADSAFIDLKNEIVNLVEALKMLTKNQKF